MKSNSLHPLTVKLKLRRGSSARVQIGEMCGTGPTRKDKATNGTLKKYPAFVGRPAEAIRNPNAARVCHPASIMRTPSEISLFTFSYICF
jgi:hypothetical protein